MMSGEAKLESFITSSCCHRCLSLCFTSSIHLKHCIGVSMKFTPPSEAISNDTGGSIGMDTWKCAQWLMWTYSFDILWNTWTAPQKIQEEKTWCKNLMLLLEKSSSVDTKNFFGLCMFFLVVDKPLRWRFLRHLEATPAAEMNPLLFVLFFWSIQYIWGFPHKWTDSLLNRNTL